jgi:hypothetical protein
MDLGNLNQSEYGFSTAGFLEVVNANCIMNFQI